MITIFRKARNALIGTKSMRNYIFYAIGEVLLVVFGILIALQVNSWNEQRKDRLYESRMLQEVINGLKQDSIRLQDFISPRIKWKLEGCQMMAYYIYERTPVDDGTFLRNYFKMRQEMKVTINTGPYEALKASGLDRIKNDSIRLFLIDLFEQVLPRKVFWFEKDEVENTLAMNKLDNALITVAFRRNSRGNVGRYYTPKIDNIYDSEELITLLDMEWTDAKSKEFRFGEIEEILEASITQIEAYLMHESPVNE